MCFEFVAEDFYSIIWCIRLQAFNFRMSMEMKESCSCLYLKILIRLIRSNMVREVLHVSDSSI